MKETGLQFSKASGMQSMFNWTSYDSRSDVGHWSHQYPDGFDHTEIFYSKARKLHVLITEPYHETNINRARKAMFDLSEACGKHIYLEAFGEKGRGLWNPGPCLSYLICRPGKFLPIDEKDRKIRRAEHEDFLFECAKALPKKA